MRKGIIILILVAGVIFIYWGCTKTAVKPPANGCTPAFPHSNVTYNNYVSNIISAHCATCHNGGGIGPGNFTTYSGVLPYVSQFSYRVISDNADMPQGNAPLPKSTRDSLNIWVQNCTPEK